jgi:hypothetical protein
MSYTFNFGPPTSSTIALTRSISLIMTFATSSKFAAKIPFGVTWSNRTELIKANEVRGHIGFTFDWDSLFSGAKN